MMMFLAGTVPAPTQSAQPALDAASIKELMDGFDPAALLPSLQKLFGSLEILCRVAVMIAPVVMLVLGLAYLFLAPREANYYFGYRCYFGMGSVPAWRFTQKVAGLLLSAAGLALTIVMFVISGGFGSMEVTDMVWKAASCLAWQAGIALLVTLAINTIAAVTFDRRGELRRRRKQ